MWYESIRYASPKIEVDPEGLTFKDKIVPQNAQIRFRYKRGTFLYGAVTTNTETGSTWIECREWTRQHGAGKWRSIPLDQFKSQVLPRKVKIKSVKQPTRTPRRR